MTINDPIVSGGTLNFGLSGVDTALSSWYVFKTDNVVGITGSDPETITNYLSKYFPLDVITSSTTEFEITDFPYVSGKLTLFLEDSSGWTRKDFTLENTKRGTGINFPVQIRTSGVKQPTPLMDTQDIKGAPKYYGSFHEFLYMPREHMVPKISAYVFDEETNTIKQFILERNGIDKGNGTFNQISESDISSIPYPLLKADITNSRSYQRFWTLISESETVAPTNGIIRYYAPDYEDGVPPLYDNLLDTGTPGVTYPVGLAVPSDSAYDKQREFLGVWSYDEPTAQFINANAPTSTYFASRQVTKNEKPGDKWFIESVDGISFSRWRRIGQFDEGSVQQNRYIRRVTDIGDPYGTLSGGEDKFPPTPQTFFEGNRNRFGRYKDDFLQGTFANFQYEDIPPDKRNNQAGLSAAESSMYDDFITDGVSAIDVDGLWEITCIKDKYNRLESDFNTARYIPNNGDLVRYSINQTPNINDLDEADWVSNGWVTEFDPDIHRYKAERANTDDDFQIVLISAEIGTYTSRVYKAYPLRYFDSLTNVATRTNYTPVGIAAGINPNDNVDVAFTYENESMETLNAPNKGAWVDAPFIPPLGWTLWVSEAVFFFGGSKLKSPWSVPVLSDTEAQVIDQIEGQEDFHSTPTVDDNGNSTVAYDPATIDLTATLYLYTQRETDEGQQYVINDDPNETIKYKWERIFNNGASDSTIIFDNTSGAGGSELISDGDLVSGSFTYSPGGTDTFRIESSGRVLRIYPDGLDKRAIYKVTQERTTAGGTVTYTEETAGLLDIADGLPSKLIVATVDQPYFVLKGDAQTSGGVWQADDYTNPKDGSNYPEIILRAFVQNVDDGAWYRWSSGQDFDSVRLDDLGGGTTKEKSLSGTYWTQISSSKAVPVAADSTPWNDGTVNKRVIYKYQSGAFYDIVRIERIQEGADVRTLDLKASSQVVSYNSGETDYQPSGQVIEFRAIAQNMSAAGINWEILDKTGADISDQVILYDQSSGGSPINDGDTVGYLRTGDYPAATAWRYNNLYNNLPVTVKLTHDDYTDQQDFVTFRKISDGADGPAGEDAIQAYLDNESETQSCNEDGIPINASLQSINGSLALKTSIVVYSGVTDVTTNYKIGNATPFTDITAVDENGASLTKGTGSSQYNYQLSNANRTIAVTRLPEDKQKIVISLPIRRASDNSLVVTRKFTISKSLAGVSPLRIVLDNEFMIGTRTPDTAVIGSSSSGLSGYGVIGSVKIQGFVGLTEQSLSLAGNSSDSIVGYQGNVIDPFGATWSSPGALGEASARYNRYTEGGNDIYLVLGASGTLYIISRLNQSGSSFDYTIAFQTATRFASAKISVRWLEQPSDFYQVVVYSSDPSFSANEPASASTLVSARVVNKQGTETASIPSGWTIQWSAGTNVTAQSGYTSTVRITRAQVNISKQVTAKLLNADNNVVSVGTITIYDLKDAPNIQELFYASDSATFPSRPTGSYSSFPSSSNEQWGQTQNVNKKYLYLSRRSEYDTEWGWPIQVKGEEGKQGIFAVPVRVYKVSAEKPTISGGSVPSNPADYTTFGAPSGWSKTPEYQGVDRLWVATRLLQKDGDTWTFSGSWSVSLLGGNETLSEVYVYRGSSTSSPAWVNDYDSPESQYPQSGGSNWKQNISDLSSPTYTFRARGKYGAGALRQRIISGNHAQIELNAVSRESLGGGEYRFRDENNNIITKGNTGDAYIYVDNLYIKLGNGNWDLDNSDLHWWDKPELITSNAPGPTGPAGQDGDITRWSKTFTDTGAVEANLLNFDTGSTSSKTLAVHLGIELANYNNEGYVEISIATSTGTVSSLPPSVIFDEFQVYLPNSGEAYPTNQLYTTAYFILPATSDRYLHIQISPDSQNPGGEITKVFATVSKVTDQN